MTWLNRQLWILLVSAILLLGVFELTSLDIWLVQYFFSPELGQFPLKDQPFFTSVLHHGLKTGMYITGVASIVVSLWFLKKSKDTFTLRHALVGILGVILIPAMVALLKHLTNKHCPWSLDMFGGAIPYTGLFEVLDPLYPRGQCFPAGHAAGGFMWFSWAIALWGIQPRLAKFFFYAAIFFGLLMGVARMAQGAHFFSHVLWTAWFAWAIGIILAYCLKALPSAGRHKGS